MRRFLDAMFGCSHQKTTFPLTPGRNSKVRSGTYVVCLDCGREFSYNWEKMRVGAKLEASVPKPPDGVEFARRAG